jgi:type III pantothenate kinase
MKAELEAITESNRPVTVVATGGLATMIDGGVDCIDYVDKLLTLEGLEIIYQKNRRCGRHHKE